MKLLANSSLWIASLLLLGTLILSSCDKEKEDPEIDSIPLLESIVTHSDGGQPDFSQFFHYDNQGRLIKVEDNDGYVTTMEYTESTVTVKDSEDGELKDTSIGQLDSKGLCTSMIFEGVEENATYEYDSNGYRKSSSFEDRYSLITNAYTVSDGNCVTIISMSEWTTGNSAFASEVGSFRRSFLAFNLQKRIPIENRLKSTTTSYINKSDYQFYKDKSNTIGNENIGISFMGKQNKNPIKQETNTITYNNEVASPQTVSYTYEYDANGWITKQTSSNGDYSVYTYERPLYQKGYPWIGED